MKLKKIEIQGFKSFPDKTEVLFNEGITGIVGPNGSGKSNIGDAVRWVLGEQSAKALRGSKMEDVIFGGTQKRKRATFCEVSLYFDNADQSLKTPFSEVCVTRRVYRSGEGEYYLNKSSCRLKDILELFRDTGIGKEGYSMIGQGRVDEILSNKSEERRAVFEEAAGIMTFRVRKEESERKLGRVDENLTRVNDILSELEGRLGPLYAQSETAREYQMLFERLKTLEINIFLVRYDRVKERIDSLEKTLEGLRDILLGHEGALNEAQSGREQAEAQLDLLEQALEEARLLEEQSSEKQHAAELTLQGIQAELSAAKEEKSRQEAARESAEKRLTELHALDETGSGEKTALQEGLNEAQNALSEAKQALSSAEQAEFEAENALNAHKEGILAAAKSLGDARAQYARNAEIGRQMEKNLEQVLSSMADLQQELAQAHQHVQECLEKQQETRARYDALRADAEDTAQNLQLMSDQLKQKGAQVQQKNLALQADLTRLRLLSEMSREMEGYQQSVRRALEFAKGDNRVRGVLARLITVPKEMETAIDMVLGGALQNIVTEDENAAKRVIDHLRTNRLGRATFLPMTTVRSRVLTPQERSVLRMPGCLGVASELISYPEEYRGIVENLLGRTLVADNLEHGIAIMRAGRQAFRLVTVLGDVMHSGGSMTGGTVQGKTTSLLGREREIKELEGRTTASRESLLALQNEMETITKKRDGLLADQSDVLYAVHQEEIATAREDEHLRNAQAEEEALAQRLAQTLSAKEQLEAGIRQTKEELQAAQTLQENQSQSQSDLEEQTLRLQNALLDARNKTDECRARVSALQLKYSDEEHALDTLLRDGARRRQEMAVCEGRLSEAKDMLDALENTLSGLSQKELTQTETLNALTQTHHAHRLLWEDTDKKRQDWAKKQREFVNKTEEIRAVYDQDLARQHRTELALSKAQTDLSAMCDHILNAYELTYAGAAELRSEETIDLPAFEREAAALRERIRQMGTVNVASIEEYEQEKARFDDLSAQRDDLVKAKEDLEGLIARLLKQMEKQFTGEFSKLQGYFTETFTRLFGGGQAELRLADESNPLTCDIEVIAQPPGKKLQLLSLLSGGERALCAIAILFAMLKLKPTPFCILDEIEAALDDANISYFADYLAEYAASTQFVVVTHRKGTMERCNSLYGVSMAERGVSGIVSVNLEDYEE